jgi:23S rRNA pseudouridine2457 synthase
MLSQFTQEIAGQRTLQELGIEARDVYAAGRLDRDSEGLLLLSNSGLLIKRMLGVQKVYYAQVEGDATEAQLRALEQGVEISVAPRRSREKYVTAPAEVRALEPAVLNNFEPPPPGSIGAALWDSTHVRRRKLLPTQWLEVRLREGKHRQVRKMLAVVGLPCLRLVRVAIGPTEVFADPRLMEPGAVVRLDGNALLKALG